MPSMTAIPRKGHLEHVYTIFGYLKSRYNSQMVFDPTVTEFNEDQFSKDESRYTQYTWSKELIPANNPKSRFLGLTVNVNVDSDHEEDEITYRSRTEYWFIKKQRGIKTSTFGSEFTDTKLFCGSIRGLTYKLLILRILGILGWTCTNFWVQHIRFSQLFGPNICLEGNVNIDCLPLSSRGFFH